MKVNRTWSIRPSSRRVTANPLTSHGEPTPYWNNYILKEVARHYFMTPRVAERLLEVYAKCTYEGVARLRIDVQVIMDVITYEDYLSEARMAEADWSPINNR